MPKLERDVTSARICAFAKLISLLQDGVLSMTDLAAETGLHVLTINRYCAALHQAGVAHIHAWGRDPRGVYSVRLYKLGRGKDALPPYG